jgi:hypothetical protein
LYGGGAKKIVGDDPSSFVGSPRLSARLCRIDARPLDKALARLFLGRIGVGRGETLHRPAASAKLYPKPHLLVIDHRRLYRADIASG